MNILYKNYYLILEGKAIASLLGWLKRDIVDPVQRDIVRPVNNLIVRPALQTASKAENTLAAAGAGLGGLVRASAGAVTHNPIAEQNAINESMQAINKRLALNKAFLTARQANQGGTALIRPTLSAAGQVAPYAVGGIGGSLVKGALAFGGVNAASTALQGDLKAKDLAKSFALGAVPVGVGHGLKVGGKVAVRETNMAGRPARLSDRQIANISNYRAQMGQGNPIADNVYHPAVRDLQKAGIKHTDTHAIDNLLGKFRTYQTNREGGFVKLPDPSALKSPGKNLTPVAKSPKSGEGRGVPLAPNTFKRAYESVGGVISQHGAGGKEIANKLAEHRNQSEIGQAAFLEKIPSVGKLKKHDFRTFVDSLESLSKGEKINASPKIQKAIGEWNKAIPSIRQRAVKAGLEVGDLGPNYFPRHYKNLFSSDKAMAKVAKEMVDSGKASDLGDAIGKLQFMKHEHQRPFGNLEKTREFDLPGYDKSHEALTNYVSRSFDRITKAEQFGAKNEMLKDLLGKIQSEGYSATPGSTLDKNLKIALGDVDKSTLAHRASGTVRKFNALRSLSTAGISNATQLTNTATIAGIGRTAKGIAELIVSPKSRAEARQTGTLLDHSISELAKQGLGTGGKITKNIASPFFRSVEKFNRQTTAIVGKDYGNKLARQGDVKQLRDKFGVKGDIGKKLTRDQEIQVSRKLVELSQFKVDPVDLPAWIDSPTGKLIAQFRTFGYKQTGFMYNQVLREAIKGNFLPLSRFVALGAPLGAGALAVKGAIKGAPTINSDDSSTTKAVKGLSQVGGFGLPGSEGLNIYNSAKFKNTPGALAGTLGGPTTSFVTETADNVRTGQQTGSYKKLEKQGVRSIPTVGPSIANRAFPKKPSQAEKATQAVKETGNQDIANIKANPPKSYSLQKTSDGKFAYTFTDGKVHTSEKLSSAQDAIRRDIFGKSELNFKIIGDTVYRKDAQGKVSSQSKDSYDYTLNSAKLTAYKKADNTQAWFNSATDQLKLIDKQLNEPNLDELDKIKLQNEAQILVDSMNKYQSYGGFKKGRSSGRKRSLVASYKVTKTTSSKISKPKGVSVRKLSSPKFSSSGVKKISVTKISSSARNRKLG